MTSNTIISLAVLKVNWDIKKQDYIEVFAPFFLNLILTNNYERIDVDKLRSDFEQEYGLHLPHHPSITILNRLVKNKFLIREGGQLKPNRNIINAGDFAQVSTEQKRILNHVISQLITFCNDKYKEILTIIEAENAILNFLAEYQLEILFAYQGEGSIPEVHVSKTHQFLVSKFFQHAVEQDPKIADYFLNIAIGYVLANTILYNEFDRFSGKLKGVNYYLDTGYLFFLIGANGEILKEAFEELTNSFLADGANLFIFQHTYDELMKILRSCVYWIDNPDYDPEKAGRALRFFYTEGFSKSDVEVFINKVSAVFIRFQIKVVPKPSYFTDKQYQVDETELRKVIVEKYELIEPLVLEYGKELTIQRDIDSISAIYRLRQGQLPHTLKEAKHVFITTNSALARASYSFEKAINPESVIPTCMTDVFVGTLIWLYSPAKVVNLKMKQLMANAFAAIQPDTLLIGKYLRTVEKLKKDSSITTEDYYLLRTTSAAYEFLADKTLGDEHRLTEKTGQEILYEIKTRLKKESEAKLTTALIEHEKEKTALLRERDIKQKMLQDAKTEILKERGDKLSLQGRLENRIEIITKVIAGFFYLLLLLVAILAFVDNYFPSFVGTESFSKALGTLFIIFSGWFLYDGGGLKDAKFSLKKQVRKLVRKIILG